MKKLICTLLAAAFVTASAVNPVAGAEYSAEISATAAQESVLASGEYAVDISWTPMAGMISPVLNIDAENMTFNLYNASAPETSKGSGTVSCADGAYTLNYSDGNTTAFTLADDVITFTSKLFYGTASFDQTDDSGNFVPYTATANVSAGNDAEEDNSGEENTITVSENSTLVCYMPAMGGCNLAENIVESVAYTEKTDGSVTITLDFYEIGEWSSMYFSGQTAYVSDEGQLAYFDGTAWVDAEYTTAASSDGSYSYVDTMTFSVVEKTDTYELAIPMSGYQFGGDTPSTVSSGEEMTATLTMEWSIVTDIPEDNSEATTTTAATTTTTKITTTTTATAVSESTTSVTEADAGTKLISITDLDKLDAGTYQLTSSLSCYMSAMGGCDFGKDLLKSAVLTVDADGTKKVTVYLHEIVDVVMVYGTASAYAENSGEIGYYNGTKWCDAEYTTATGTSDEGTYTYVNSLTFPINALSDTYDLALCIGGTQFGGESARMISDGSVLAAKLSIDWDKAYTNVTVSSNGTVTDSGSSSPKTGENSPLAAGIAMFAAAAAAAYLSRRKSER